jgi:tetratricopeptide (TPR) repeat protein
MWLFETCIIDQVKAQEQYAYLTERAENNYQQGLFDETIIDCERYLFVNPHGNFRFRTVLLEAKALQQKGDFENSTLILLSLPKVLMDSMQRTLISYNLAINSYMQSNYDEASTYLDDCVPHNLPIGLKNSYEILNILTRCQAEQWDSAISAIQRSSFPQIRKDSLISFVNNRPKLLNRNRLEKFSRIIPGSGQILAGYYEDGVINFALCLSALSFGIYEMINGYYFTGYIVGAGLLYEFYYGGLRRLNNIVSFENQKRKSDLVKNIKIVVER